MKSAERKDWSDPGSVDSNTTIRRNLTRKRMEGAVETETNEKSGEVDAVVMPARCHKCINRTRFDNGAGISLYLCMAQPYEEEEEYGIVTWLDTANFESGHCLDFKEAKQEAQMSSLADALPKEQERVRRLILQYRDPTLKGAGELAARMMEISLQAADKAVMSGDLVAMIRCYEDLKSYEA